MVVVFEGLPGSGKSEVVEYLASSAGELGFTSCIVSRAETCSPEVARLIEIAREHPFGYPERNMLYWVARVHHDAHVARLAHEVGKRDLILVDRLWGSLMAYSHLLHFGVSADSDFWDIYPRAFLTHPDLTILLDIPVEVARTRKNSPTLLDRVVAKTVRERYQGLAMEYRWKEVDATLDLEAVESICRGLVYEFGPMKWRRKARRK